MGLVQTCVRWRWGNLKPGDRAMAMVPTKWMGASACSNH